MVHRGERLGFWGPGIWLSRRLRMPVKLGVLAAIVLVTLLVVLVLLERRQSAELAFTRGELEGLKVLRPVGDVAALVLRQGELMALQRTRGAGTAEDTALAATRSALDRAVAEAGRVVAASPLAEVATAWRPLAARVQALPGEAAQQATPALAMRLHHVLAHDLRHLIVRTADVSGLLYEPDALEYQLMDQEVNYLPPWSLLLSRFSGEVGMRLAAGADAGLEILPDRVLLARIDNLADALADRRVALELLRRAGGADFGLAAAIAATDEVLTVARQLLAGSNAAPPDARAFADAATRAQQALEQASNQVNAALDARLRERESAMAWGRQATLVGAVLGLLVLIYYLLTLHRSVMIDIRRINYAMNQLAIGNLRVNSTVKSNDEFGDLAKLMAAMIRNVSAMVSTVGSNAALVAHAGHQLRGGNDELARRTDQQASSLDQTAGSVRELASTVQQNADTAREVDRQASALRGFAEQGGESMRASVQAVEAIQSTAGRMNDIIAVIDRLAFQTNILALNAAVEAARAGSAGRGFAVVASEVRSLAQRSATNAREVRDLIQASSSQVGASVDRIHQAGDGMERIVQGIQKVSADITRISTASAEQSSSLSEVATAVQQLDDITQDNARMVERAVLQSDSLVRQAGSLAQSVSNFRLLQGVAPEAHELVQRALEYRRMSGSRDAFLRGLTDPASNFHDRDMYVFALDVHGTYRAFAGNAAKVGTRVHDVPGIDGQALMDAIRAQADEGPGWVDYQITNPTTGDVQGKMSFTVKVDDLYLGCGVYTHLAPAR